MSGDRLIAEMGRRIQEGAIGRISTIQILVSAKERNIKDVLNEALCTLFCLNKCKIERVRFQGDKTFLQGALRFSDGSAALLDVDIIGDSRIFVEVQGSKGLIVLPSMLFFPLPAEKKRGDLSYEARRTAGFIKKSVLSGSVIRVK